MRNYLQIKNLYIFWLVSLQPQDKKISKNQTVIMSGVIHLKRNPILILCIPVLILVLILLYHERIFDTPSGQRRILQAELRERMNVLDNATLKHLPIFRGGNPRRIVIFTNEYSGYEFLEEILLTIPGVFIHKPLTCESSTDAGDDRDWSIVSKEFREMIINETLTRKINPLLRCQSTGHRELIGTSSILSSEVQEYCDDNSLICSTEYFQRQLCEMSSLQVLVLKNFDFHIALHLKNLKDLHIVYLIRDPRAVSTEQTDLTKGGCRNFTHCFEVSDLCKSMRNSEETVETLVQKRYRHFKLLRIEELAFNLMQEMILMFESWGIAFTVDTYNVMNELKPKIDQMAFKWDYERPFADVNDIQEKCKQELEFYAFKLIEDQKELDLQVRTINDLLSRLKTIEAEGNQ